MGERVIADTETTLYALVKPEVGASSDSWGSKLNNNINDLDALLGCITTAGSSSTYTLTTGLSLAAYVSGQKFLVKWNHTNGGSATLNVDSLGAKTIKKRDASTNCSASDLVSGAVALLVYDGTNMVLHGYVASDIAAVSQPLDATLTALAAVTYGGSGSPVLQWTAADTVSLTSSPTLTTPTITSLEWAGGTDATVTRSGAGRIAVEGVDLLGTTLTQSVTNKQIRTPTSGETSGTLTSASSNKVVVASGGITIDGNVHTAGDMIVIYAGASSRTITQGTTGTPTQRLHGSSTTGNLTLAARGVAGVYFISATEWVVSGDVT